MRKFFDSRRELVSSGPGSGGGGGGSGSSHAGGNFIGRAFTIGRHQVTVEEIIAEGERKGAAQSRWCCLFVCLSMHAVVAGRMCVLHAQAKCMSHLTEQRCKLYPHRDDGVCIHVSWMHTHRQNRGPPLSLACTLTDFTFLIAAVVQECDSVRLTHTWSCSSLKSFEMNDVAQCSQ